MLGGICFTGCIFIGGILAFMSPPVFVGFVRFRRGLWSYFQCIRRESISYRSRLIEKEMVKVF